MENKLIQQTISLDPETYKRIEKEAKRNSLSFSEVLRTYLKKGMER